MMFIERDSKVWSALASVISDEGFELYDLERFGSSGLRVTIANSSSQATEETDSKAGVSSTGIFSKDCSRVCKRLLVFHAVEGAELGLSEEPQLEVSSPGVNRALRDGVHFKGALGERIRVICSGASSANGKQKNEILGVLEAFEGESLKVRDEKTEEIVSVDLSGIKRAKVDFRFEQ